MGLIDDIKSWTRKNSAPFSVLLVASFVASCLLFWFMRMKGIELLILSNAPSTPIWTVVTYPWAYFPFGSGLTLMCFLCLMFWLLQIGPSIERDIGTPRFAVLWFASTILAGTVMVFGASAFHVPVAINAPYLPESAVTIVWCVRNRTSSVMLFGFIPLTGFWLGWATAIMDLLLYGAGAPVVGVLAIVHLGVAALYALERIPFLPYGPGNYVPGRRIGPKEKQATTRGQVQYDQSYFDEVKRREQARADEDRLKKLFGDE